MRLTKEQRQMYVDSLVRWADQETILNYARSYLSQCFTNQDLHDWYYAELAKREKEKEIAFAEKYGRKSMLP